MNYCVALFYNYIYIRTGLEFHNMYVCYTRQQWLRPLQLQFRGINPMFLTLREATFARINWSWTEEKEGIFFFRVCREKG